jgi:outer membrane protein OmpA-like peptidoglycan-associated protein/flagellar hook assembly protein FlgD
MKKITAVVIFIISTLTAFAQSTVHSAGDLAYNLYSIQSLGGGVHVTDMNTPQNTMYNAASAATIQRTTADLNYINLQGLGTLTGTGHALNGALSYPTRFGVMTGSLHWIGTDDLSGSSMDYGNVFSGNFSFSKELYSDILIGAGVTFSGGTSYGSSTDSDWGVGLNLGFIHMPGDIGMLKNFRWGIVLDNMGKGYGDESLGYDQAIPGNFTLGGGLQFDLIEKKSFIWSVVGDVRSPTFTDLKFDIGTDILIASVINIDTSLSFSLRDAIAGEAGTLIPSVGISIKIPLGAKDGDDVLGSSEMNFNIAAAPLYDDIWAFGGGLTVPFGVLDNNPPDLKVEFNKKQYISPNFDGEKDELIIPITVEDQRYIKGYSLIIKNEEGYIVKEIYNKDERPENESIKNIFTRLVSPKEGTPVPQSFRWDGKADTGEMVPDGTYNFTIVFWDDNRNFTDPYPGLFVIDTVSPEINVDKLEGTDLIFSPDGDGNKDTIRFNQSGSEESEWRGIITDAAGNVVKEFIWYGTIDNAIWDGTDNNGTLVPDGVYQYEVISIDEAGNTVKNAVANTTVWDDLSLEQDDYAYEDIAVIEAVDSVKNNVISNIIVNTKKPPVHVYIDKAWFAPASVNGEKVLVFTLDVPVKTGIIEWELDILNNRGVSVNKFSSRTDGWGPVPETIVYDGTDTFRKVIEETSYYGKLTIKYQNGYNPVAESPVFNVDTTPPQSTLSTSYRVFSPNGDNNKDQALFAQTGSVEDEWIGQIVDESGNVVKTYSWKNGIERSIQWDGRKDSGDIAADGVYNYSLYSKDKAGNSSRSNVVTVQLDNSDTEAAISVNLDAFSPNGDRVKDQIELHPLIKVGSSIKSYAITIVDKENKKIKSWAGTSAVPQVVNWNGKLENGESAADGLYRSTINVIYEKGDVREASSTEFLLDTVSPKIDIETPYRLFSPDGDFKKDKITISQISSREDEFYGQISDAKGNVIKTWFWSNQLTSVEWDGNDKSGNRTPDGKYLYTVTSEDKAGNKTVQTISDLMIDTSDTPVFLTVKNSAFAPSLTQGVNTQIFTMIVSNTRAIDSWKLVMVHADGTKVKSFSSTNPGQPPSDLIWNGLSDNGSIVEGSYIAQLSIVYNKGNNPVVESTPFILDNSAPDVRLLFNPQPFSPDDDNVDDELNISISVDDLSPVRNWEMIINDPKGREFISFKGRGRPSDRIIWDGRSMKGELVQSAEDYSYAFTAQDILGNSKTVNGVIPVDVLVVRDGDRFKIQISSITFKPNSAEYNDSGDLKEKNEKILSRIAEILKKYSSYSIIIEGNAASTKYYNKNLADKEEVEELQPLSLQRAETVRDSLISFGIGRNRLNVEGKGGTNPVVPHSDLDNAWKNRRVEFILLK